MKLNKYTLIFLSAIILSSLSVLLFIQFRILEKDIENNQNVMEFSIPGILSDLYDNLIFNEDLKRFTHDYHGTGDFSFTSNSSPEDSLQMVIKNGLDQVLALNYPKLNYEVNGFISNEYGCMIHHHHRPNLPKAERILNAENHLCFCMILDNTLDIAMNYENKEETAIGNSAALLRTSFLLILIILGVFGYAFYIILKQKKISDLKRDFVNNLTHEFKTPIFSISLAAKTLKERGKSQQLETLDTLANLISHEANRLKTHVDNILQIAMIDSGNFSLDKKNIDLHAAIHHVVSSFSMILHKRNGKIRLILEAQNHTVFADETHINNLLYNLIDNGQKYSEGAPDIEIMTSDHKDGIHLTIKDHGIGMDKTTQKYVFDQFYRSQQGDIHTVKGFGLGLSYVKKIVDLHKGSIHLKSDPGKGSAFTIFLPRIS